MDRQALHPRRAALDLLEGVCVERRLLSEIAGARLAPLAPAERARAQRLANATLRAMDRADRMLGPHLRRRPPERVMNLLRLGTVEICELGEAPHGVVNAAVSLARESDRFRAMAGLVNAVLRKIANRREGWGALPVPRLPRWLRKPLVADYGRQVVEAMEAAHYAGAPLDLTARDAPEAIAAALGGRLLPLGSVRLGEHGQVSALPGFREGLWWVQDVAAAQPARLLAPRPGERVLDMCAAPGGKTMQLAAAGAEVTALDLSQRRMERLAENLERTGLRADMVVADALEFEAAAFDAVLLDAPCSATGTIRRHPDLPHARDGSEFPALFALQSAMIDKALALLRPGGRLVYSTCSLLIDEGEEQVRDALARHPGLTVDAGAVARLPGVEPAWRGEEGGLRLRPDFLAGAGGMDGFYMAAMVKPGG